jgi:MoCo/4Fe-4S cofactor protein with predicted Tat translocation signal
MKRDPRENNRIEYWRSLDQLADTPEFREFLHREFPESASEQMGTVTRRNFLQLMGASLALAGLSGCRRPVEKIIPYVVQPEEVVPGVPLYFASSMPSGTGAYGVVVESHEGRPTKIEGNKMHPSSRGAANSIIQASVLDLYDPDRSADVMHNGMKGSWEDFVSFWRKAYVGHVENGGAGLAVLSGAFASPTLSRLKKEFEKKFPKATWVAYDPINDDNRRKGLRSITGKDYQPEFRLDQASVILSLDSDFLLTEPDNVANTKRFTDGRHVESTRDQMNRLYVVESNYTVTGTVADHRLRLPVSRIGAFAVALAGELKRQGVPLDLPSTAESGNRKFNGKWLTAVARDLIRANGRSLLIAGPRQPREVHALVHALNDALGNIGKTLVYREYVDAKPSDDILFGGLLNSMKGHRISTLIILAGNPVYNSPFDLYFTEALKRVNTSIHLSSHRNETSLLCNWHLPRTHYLESWGDARGFEGSLSVVQPLISPMYGGHSNIELVQLLVTGEDEQGYEIVRQTWSKFLPGDFEKRWRRVLHDGILNDSAPKPVTPRFDRRVIGRIAASIKDREPAPDNIEVAFYASPSLCDGSHANNGWLQELPDTVTKLAWDNAALLSPRTAKALHLKNGDVISLEYYNQTVEFPVWTQPGQADNSIALELGYGRTAAGKVGTGVGVNAYLLRMAAEPWFMTGVKLAKTGRTYELASMQDHHSMEGRPLIREATLDEYRRDPHFAEEMVETPKLQSLWTEHKYDTGYQWGMAIDLNSCIGCNACTIACQSENNIPIVGKEQVINGREMHWIRLDRYFSGDINDPEVTHQPVACQQCEMAPCETVCPVAATVHDNEGLNLMTYNRCIGTRYCSNNCPYKVRRFNFFNYTKDTPETVKMAMNPDVTVRSRGVMEKCTYCLQRINRAKMTAKEEKRNVRDGEITPACQQTCPAEAIVFGNINDPESRVSRIKKQNRNYQMLSEFNLRPRTSYLARLRNPNPELSS